MIKKIFLRSHFIIALLLFFIPFSWFDSGEVDWGGDSSRLYYLDPYSYLMNHTLFGVSPSETGAPIQGFYSLPYVLLLVLIRMFSDPTFVVEFFHGIKLSFAFLFTYLSVFSILKIYKNKFELEKRIVSIIGGLTYAFSPILTTGWDKAIYTHDQVFLNPLMFYLLFKFFENGNFLYLSIMIFISLIFAHNFTASAAPAIFSFYPITLSFIFTYQVYVVKGSLYWRKLILAFILFFGIHAFHIIPLFRQFFDTGSDLYTNVFTSAGKIDRGLSYFLGVVKEIKLSTSLFALPQMSKNTNFVVIYSLVFPIIIVSSLFFRKNKILLMSLFFFLLSLFFVSANITRIGVEFYKLLFELPGFSMFRNFFGQWNNVFVFLYVILVSVALMHILSNLRTKVKFLIPTYIVLMLFFTSIPFIKGALINRSLWQSNDVRVLSIPDGSFLDSIEYIRRLPDDSKILTLPLTDPGYQLVSGKDGGAYQGPSVVAYLGGKRDFPGLGSFNFNREIVIESITTNNLDRFMQILSGFNIGYIYYNSDPYIFEENFPQFPYQVANYYFPTTQSRYKEFIDKLGFEKVAQFGDNYHIYKIDKSNYIPHVFSVTELVSSNNALKTQFLNNDNDLRKVYVQTDPNIDIGYRHDIYESESKSPFNSLINNYHLHNHDPHIAHRMDKLIYPLIVMKEGIDLMRTDEKVPQIDMSLFLMSKRISEIVKWGDEMRVSTNNASLPFGDYYMSWERSLIRYTSAFDDLNNLINKSGFEEDEKNAQLVKVDEQLKRHHAKLIARINSLDKSKEEINLLEKLINQTFEKLIDKLDLPIFSSEIYKYSIKIASKKNTNFEMLIENKDEFEDLYSFKLNLLGQEYALDLEDSNINTVYEDVLMPPGSVDFTVNFTRKNYLENSTLSKSDSLNFEYLSKESYIEEIIGFKPSTQYLISFEYYTNGENFSYSFLDRKIKDEKDQKNKYFDKNLNSKGWKVEQTILTSDMNTISGFIEFANNNATKKANLLIRNLKVTETGVPNITFVNKAAGEIFTPSIIFQRLNPVTYRIRVEKADMPYFLVLLDAFSNDWKLIRQSQLSPIIPSFEYFNGEVKEGLSRRDYPSLDLIHGWNAKNFIADNSHFMVNGYANGWYIEPSDVGAENYDMLLIYNGQKPFYIGLAISMIAIIVLVIAILRSIFFKVRSPKLKT